MTPYNDGLGLRAPTTGSGLAKLPYLRTPTPEKSYGRVLMGIVVTSHDLMRGMFWLLPLLHCSPSLLPVSCRYFSKGVSTAVQFREGATRCRRFESLATSLFRQVPQYRVEVSKGNLHWALSGKAHPPAFYVNKNGGTPAMQWSSPHYIHLCR